MEALSLRGAINLDVKTTGQEMNLQPSQKRREQRGKIRRVPMEIEPARCNGVLHTDVVLSFSISWKEDERKLETRGKINVVEKKKKKSWCYRPAALLPPIADIDTAGYRSDVHAGDAKHPVVKNVRDFELAFTSAFFIFLYFAVKSLKIVRRPFLTRKRKEQTWNCVIAFLFDF